MINHTEFEFIDISMYEEYRVYVFPDKEVRIEKPLFLHVSKSGGHRVFDSEGISHYIPPKWVHLYWKAPEGHANFVA